MLPVLALAMTLVPVPKVTKEPALTPEETATVRKEVYDGRLVSVSPKKDFVSILKVPTRLKELYQDKPIAVLDLLIRIADGGNPFDSIKAASYAIEMRDGPGRGELCASIFDEDTYDSVDKEYGCSPRERWLKHLRSSEKK